MKSLDVLGVFLVVVGVVSGGVAMCAGLGESASPPTTLGVVAGLVALAAFTGGWLRFREPSAAPEHAAKSPESAAEGAAE